ncbi:MAG: tRNA (adenosine(37)-N6)-threonylcarbamoyltransferase complex ATPase subunit type 1 TsaE [Candidatus Paceibacterota bacterium]
MRKVESVTDMYEFAKDVGSKLTPAEHHAQLLTLSGDLGAGKTTFVQGLANYFGITLPITSPTFVIQKTYPLTDKPFKVLVHIDAYRLESANELERLGWQETLSNPTALIVLEWPEKVASSIPDWAKKLRFEHDSENTRIVYV